MPDDSGRLSHAQGVEPEEVEVTARKCWQGISGERPRPSPVCSWSSPSSAVAEHAAWSQVRESVSSALLEQRFHRLRLMFEMPARKVVRCGGKVQATNLLMLC